MKEIILNKLKEIVHDGYWEHLGCSKECGKRTMEEQQLEIYVDEMVDELRDYMKVEEIYGNI